MLASSKQRRIRKFHVVDVGTAKKCTKKRARAVVVLLTLSLPPSLSLLEQPGYIDVSKQLEFEYVFSINACKISEMKQINRETFMNPEKHPLV